MATYTLSSTNKAFMVESQAWALRHNVSTSTSPLNGNTQNVILPGSRWVTELNFPEQLVSERQQLEALFNKLQGGAHRLELWDQAAPVPRGTINTAGVFCSWSAGQFANEVQLSGAGSGRTVLAGDKFRVPLSTGLWQLCQAADDATANGSGVVMVPLVAPMRSSISFGGAVVLTRPTALFIPSVGDEISFPKGPSLRADSMSIGLVEVFS